MKHKFSDSIGGDKSNYRKPKPVVKEAFDEKAAFDSLRKEYAKIERVDPSGPSYKKMVKLLDSMDQNQLKKLEAANIKWLSSLARNRIKRPLKEEPSYYDYMRKMEPRRPRVKLTKKDLDDDKRYINFTKILTAFAETLDGKPFTPQQLEILNSEFVDIYKNVDIRRGSQKVKALWKVLDKLSTEQLEQLTTIKHSIGPSYDPTPHPTSLAHMAGMAVSRRKDGEPDPTVKKSLLSRIFTK